MVSFLATSQTLLEDFLMQHQHRMRTYLLSTQHRFSTLRRISYGFVDLFILILVFYVDSLTAGFSYANQQVVRFRNYCHAIKTDISSRLITALELAANSFFGFVISALISSGVLFNRWSNVFQTYGAQVLHCFPLLPYLASTFIILYLVSYTSKYDIVSPSGEIRLFEYLPLNPSISNSNEVVTFLTWLHRPHFAIIASLVVGFLLCIALDAFCQAVANIIKRVAASTRSYWQPHKDRLHQIWNVFQEYMSQSIAHIRAVATAYVDVITPVIYAAIASIWSQAEAHSLVLTITIIFGISLAVSTSNCDCANILSSLITIAVDRDVSLLSLMFSSIRLAASICILLANCFVLLHKQLERLILEDKQRVWVARADWLEGCICTIVITAVFYAALFLGRRMWNVDICSLFGYAIGKDQQSITAQVSVDVDAPIGSDTIPDSDEGSDNGMSVPHSTYHSDFSGGAKELLQDTVAICGDYEDSSDFLGEICIWSDDESVGGSL